MPEYSKYFGISYCNKYGIMLRLFYELYERLNVAGRSRYE